MLQDLDDTTTEDGCEAFEDKVRVALADSAALGIGNIGAQDNVVQGEAGGRTVREMADGHGSGSTTVFVNQDHVGETGALG